MAFHRASNERVNVFVVDEVCLFRHYFEGDDLFRRMRRYYNNQQYRFEVPKEEFEEVRTFLAGHGYGLVTVDSTRPFVVCVKQYTEHPDDIFKSSVVQRTSDGYNCFLLRNRDAVDEAVADGAIRLDQTDLSNPFE